MTATAPGRNELLAESVAASRAAPAEPYRGLEPFRFADAGILAARNSEIERLVRLVTMYRGVLLYGESGAGKSSVVNAGLLPRLVEEGMWPHRVRVQPWPDGELVLEPIRSSATDPNATLPSAFEGIGADGRLVLSAHTFPSAVTKAATNARIVLVFDQFEELVTLFDEKASGTDLQTRVVDAIVQLLRDREVTVKLLFVFREDYLASLEPLLARHPALADQSVRLVPPPTSEGEGIIRAPFARFAGAYGHELSDELAGRISASLAERSENGRLNLSELQIVCSRLWHAEDPATLLASRGVEGILEDFLDEGLASFDGPARDLAVVLLTRLVTSSGTRNVVSHDDLIADACEESGCEEEAATTTLKRLASEAGLVRAEHRRDVTTYEIVSEFLVPKIAVLKTERAAAAESRRVLAAAAAAHEQERAERRRARLLAGLIVAAGVVVLVAALAGYAWHQRGRSISTAKTASAYDLAAAAGGVAASDPSLADTLALDALQRRWVPEAENALRVALATNLPLRTFGRRTRIGSCCVALSPDFRYAAASTGSATRIWSVATGQQLLDIPSAAFRGMPPFAEGAPPVFSNHHTVFVNGPKHALREYSVPSGKLVRSYRGHTKTAYSVVSSPDGSRLASPGADGYVYIWNTADGSSAGDVRSYQHDPFDEAGFSSDGRELFTLKSNGLAEAWRLPNGEQPWSASEVNSFAMSPQGNLIATILRTGKIELRDASSGKIRARVGGQKLWALAAVFDRTGRFVAAQVEPVHAKLAQSIAIWSAPAGRLVGVIAVDQPINDFALSPNGRLLAVSVHSGAEIWNVATGATIASLSLGGRDGSNLAFSADGSHLVTGGLDGQVRVWDLPQFLPHMLPMGARAAWSTAFSPSGDRVAAAGKDGTLTIWSVPAGRQLLHVKISPKAAQMVAFDPRGLRVAVATASGSDAVLRADSGKLLYKVAAGGDSGSVAFSADGTRLLTSGADSVRTWNAATGAREFGTRSPFVEDAVFSPNGSEVASGGDDGDVRIWRLNDGALVRTLRPGRQDGVDVVAYSNDGEYLAAGTTAGVVVIFDARTGNRVATLRGDGHWIGFIQFTADGRHLISSSNHGTVRLWDWRPAIGATVTSGIDTGASLGFTDHGNWMSVAMPHKTVWVKRCFACRPLEALEALATQQARPLSAPEERTYLHLGESLSSKPY